LKGIYLERDIYEDHEWSLMEMKALMMLGVKVEVIEGHKLKILEDTSGQNHELCDDEDALALGKGKRGRFCP
jgi:hypothetical protein